MALAHHQAIVAHEHLGASLLGDLGRVVRAVVGDDKDVDELFGIVLILDAANELADDGLLVASGDHHRELVERLVLHVRDLATMVLHQDDDGIHGLIHVAKAEYEEQEQVEGVDECRHILAAVPLRVVSVDSLLHCNASR